MLKGFIEAHGAENHAYSAVTGISGGAVNAAILGSYAVGQELEAANRMIKFWEDSTNNKLSKRWTVGLTEGLFFKGGLYDNSPLQTFLETALADIGTMQRFVDVGLTNILTGEYKDEFASDLDVNF